MRTWLDSVNAHQNTVTATIQLETILIIGAFTAKSYILQGCESSSFQLISSFWKFYTVKISAFPFIFSLFLAFLPTFMLFFLVSVCGLSHSDFSQPPLVPLSVIRRNFWLSPNFPRLCWLSVILQTCQLSHFWRDCPTFWACKSKKEGQSHFLEISVMANFTYEQQRMMSVLHGNFTSAFSLV